MVFIGKALKIEFLYRSIYPFFRKKVNSFDELVCFVLQIEKNYKIYLDDFYSKKVSFFQFVKIFFYLLKLNWNYPLEYITQKVDFLADSFFVNSKVLIPRPETEELVHYFCQENASFQNQPITILEIGTGSGVIAISLQKRFPLAKVIAIDICDKALKVARKNAKKIIPKREITFLHGDFFSLKNQFKEIDFILSNPPYISLHEKKYLSPNTFYEPTEALFSKEDGFYFYRQFTKCFQEILKKDGKFYLEFGFNQSSKITELFSLKYKISIQKDINQKDRFLIGGKL